MKTSTLRNTISIILFAAATGTTGLAQAQQTATDRITSTRAPMADASVKTDFNLPAGKLAAALDAFGTQSGIQVNYPPELVAGKQARAVHGRMSWREALGRLLQGSGLVYRQVSGTTIVITRSQGHAGFENHPAPVHSTATASPPAPAVTNLSSITVTGTRIRGGTTPSPVITIGSEQIQAEGFTDLGEVIRSVPQNFSGGQNPGVVNGSASSQANQNITGGSSLNLRGLGPDATLTLLNGRRMAYEGFSQSIDISAIPIEAVDRIEIVPDGASAIYGSDAVGGVANVILKPDYDGMTIGMRYGSAADGGLATREYTATTGTTWSSGGLIAAWKKASNNPVYSGQRDYTKGMEAPTTLYPDGDLRSGLLSVHQSIGDDIELRLDAFRTERGMFWNKAYTAYYYLYKSDVTSSMLSPSMKVALPHDWMITIGVTQGKGKTNYRQSLMSPTESVLADNRGFYRNKNNVYEIGAEGPLFPLPGGDMRLAFGVGYRSNEFLNRAGGVTYADGDSGIRYGYIELNLPLIGKYQNVAGVRRLEFTAAIRGEDSDSFGRIATPKLGLIYGPSADFTLKASWGKSFKAPKLLNQYQNQSAYLYPATTLGGTGYAADATALVLSGGNPNLNPERARTSSASLEFHPESVPGLEAELTWFHIDYTDRVVLPLGAAVYQALGNAVYGEFVDHDPKASEQAALLAESSAFYNYAGADYDPSKVVAIVDNRYVNASWQKFKGIDLSGSYDMGIAHGHLTIRGSSSWLDSKQQLTSMQSSYGLAGTLFNPPRINGRLGAIWRSGGFIASAFANYKSGVTDTTDDVKSASFTTFDLALRYDTGMRNDILSGLAFELSVQNLLDRAPPLYTAASSSVVPYDSTNYSAIGRFISISVSKHW